MTKLEYLKPLEPTFEDVDFENNGFENLHEEWGSGLSDSEDLTEYLRYKFDEEISADAEGFDELSEMISNFISLIEYLLNKREGFDFQAKWDIYFSDEFESKKSELMEAARKEHEEYVHMVAVESRNW